MKIKNRLEQDSISGGKNIKKKIGALKRKTVPFLVVILVVTSALCYGQEPGTVHNIDTGELQQSKVPPEYILGTVHNIDTGERFHWIQDAIDDPDTNDHDTIEVYDPSSSYHPSGMYDEHIVVNKSLTLRASDGAHPIIDGGGSGNVVTILNAPDVEVSGFTIQNGGRGVFIWTEADHAIIKDNIIIDNSESGIFFGSDYHLIENNRITSNKQGIIAGCSENIGCIIRNNTIKDNTHDGMHLLAVSEFTITKNRITNNTWGINFYDGCGGSCRNNLVIENRINSNAGNGIGLYDYSNNNHIQSNDISDNGYGVEIRGYSNNNEIKGNRIIDNEYGIRIMYSTVIGNVIYNNYFNNTHNAHDEGTNEWNYFDKTDEDDGEDYNIIGGDWFGGNYWSDYTGEDDGSGTYPHDEIDGLGDTQVPYTCYEEIQNGGDDLPLVSENCLYSSSETMQMLTTPDHWDVNNPPENGWTEINVIPDDDADNSAWGDRFPDWPWHVMYFKGAHWVYGNVYWDYPDPYGHEYYKIPLTVVHEVQGWNCVTLHFKAYVDDTATFYITGPGYSTPTLFFEYPASISMDEHNPQEFTIDCLQPGDYTIYIDHRDTGGMQYGLIFTAECVSCPCSMPGLRAADAEQEDREEDRGICLGSVLLTGMLALGAVALNRKKE